jgi:hypothetical protein
VTGLGEARGVAGSSTAHLAVRLRGASLRMTVSLILNRTVSIIIIGMTVPVIIGW